MAKKIQYKTIDDLNAAQKKMSRQCQKIEKDALATVANPTGLLMDVGLGFLTNKFLGGSGQQNVGGLLNLFKKKNKTNSSRKSSVPNSVTSAKPNGIMKNMLRGGARVFIKYQLLNLGLWLGGKAIDAIKKKNAERKLNKASEKLDKAIAAVKSNKPL